MYCNNHISAAGIQQMIGSSIFSRVNGTAITQSNAIICLAFAFQPLTVKAIGDCHLVAVISVTGNNQHFPCNLPQNFVLLFRDAGISDQWNFIDRNISYRDFLPVLSPGLLQFVQFVAITHRNHLRSVKAYLYFITEEAPFQ